MRESGSPQRPEAAVEPSRCSSPPGTRAPRRSARPAPRARQVGPRQEPNHFAACGIAVRTDAHCTFDPPPRPRCCLRGKRVEQPVGMTREILGCLILQTHNVAGRARDREVTAGKYTGDIPGILHATSYKFMTCLRSPSLGDMTESSGIWKSGNGRCFIVM
jgi:hypothetical protein